MKVAAFLLILFVFPSCSRARPEKVKKVLPAAPKVAENTIVEFISKKGVFRVQAELAVTPARRERGLMFRKKLDADKGMLFVFPGETINTFWMKNTLIPLDMVFIDKAMRVIGIVHHARPLDETPVGPDKPSKYVVELPAGTARSRGIVIGASVVIKPSLPKAE